MSCIRRVFVTLPHATAPLFPHEDRHSLIRRRAELIHGPTASGPDFRQNHVRKMKARDAYGFPLRNPCPLYARSISIATIGCSGRMKCRCHRPSPWFPAEPPDVWNFFQSTLERHRLDDVALFRQHNIGVLCNSSYYHHLTMDVVRTHKTKWHGVTKYMFFCCASFCFGNILYGLCVSF